MKKLHIIVCILFCIIARAQIVNIPDANFKALLVNSSTALNTASDCTVGSYYKIDINDNGEIEVNEALAVCGLILINANISDLTGIEAFTNLRSIWCAYNNLTNVNLSSLTQLEGIIFYDTQLTALDISNLPNLTQLDCTNNQITTLNFANNPMLERVFCSNNQLTSLDFSANSLFDQLDCYNNPNLTTVNIANGTTQLLGTQTYYNQCWSGLPNLTTICADNNELIVLQSYLTGCGVDIGSINFHGNCALGNEEFANDSIQIYPNPTTDLITISFKTELINNCQITIYDFLGRILIEKTAKNSDTSMDISLNNYAQGNYILKIIDEKTANEIIKKIIKQ